MIHIVSANNMISYADAMQKAHRLRYKVFVEEKKWAELDRGNGLEFDQFDNDRALHMLYIDEANEVLGYQRMLPTTGPHLLSDVLPQLCEGPRPVGNHIWEWTRFAVDKNHRERMRGQKLSPIGLALLTGIVEWGLSGSVNQIIIQMNPNWLLVLLQLKFKVTPLGFPEDIAGEPTLAVTAEFDRRTLLCLQEMRGSNTSVFSPSLPMKKIA